MWFWPNIHEIPIQAFVGPSIENHLGFPTKKGFWSLWALIQKHFRDFRCLLLLRANSKHNVSTKSSCRFEPSTRPLLGEKNLQRTTSILVIRDLNSRTPRLSFSVCTTTTTTTTTTNNNKKNMGSKVDFGHFFTSNRLWYLVADISHSVALTFSTTNLHFKLCLHRSTNIILNKAAIFKRVALPSRSFSQETPLKSYSYRNPIGKDQLVFQPSILQGLCQGVKRPPWQFHHPSPPMVFFTDHVCPSKNTFRNAFLNDHLDDFWKALIDFVWKKQKNVTISDLKP